MRCSGGKVFPPLATVKEKGDPTQNPEEPEYLKRKLD